jgi:sacsin
MSVSGRLSGWLSVRLFLIFLCVLFIFYFVAMGVRQNFSVSDYVSLLSFLAAERGGKPFLSSSVLTSEQKADEAQVRQQQQNQQEVDAIIQILMYLSDKTEEIRDSASLFVLNEKHTLVKSSTCIFNDVPWLNSSPVEMMKKYTFVHPKLSNETAASLGVASLRRLLVNTSSQALTLSLELNLTGAEAFGQSESLTRRLKNILSLYPEGPQILYELIQNADDARATEVCFMLNKKSYNQSSLLSSSIAAWQGPALYAYNNSVFTDEDFQNLSKIGQGSKLDKISTTGLFDSFLCLLLFVLAFPTFCCLLW